MLNKLIFAQLVSVLLLSSSFADVYSDLKQCEMTCSQSCIELEARLETSIRDYKRACGGTRPNPNPPGPGPSPRPGAVEIYHSDSCSSNLIASVSDSTNCSSLESTGTNAWGIKINGVCKNIDDVSVAKACAAFASGASRDAVEIYRSDSCSSNLNAIVGPRSDCSLLSSSGTDAWGVKINGVCRNIDDMSLSKACSQFGSANVKNAVKIFHSDSCSADKVIATVTRSTDCSGFASTGSDAWGVEINGRCENISDTNVRDACERFKGSALK